MCLKNLIQLRQRFFAMKSKLELEDNTCAVGNTLQNFLHEQILQRNSYKNSISPVSISTECQEIADMNKNDLKPVKSLQLETNLCEATGQCSDDLQIAVTNEDLDIKDEMLNLSPKFEDSDEDFDYSDINNKNEYDPPQNQLRKDTLLKTEIEIENSASDCSTLKQSDSECDGRELNVEMLAVNTKEEIFNVGNESMKEKLEMKQGKHISKSLEFETSENISGDGVHVTFQIANVCTIVSMLDVEDIDVRSGIRMKLRSRSSNKSAAIMKKQPSRTYIRQHQNKGRSTALKSDAPGQTPASTELLTCTLCNKTFTTRGHLTRHAFIHSADKPYQCTVCHATFIKSYDLTVHARIHTGEKPYECTICNKTFRVAGSLITHKRTHTGDKPYKCTVCNKAFINCSNLYAHKRTHSVDKPYKCNICQKSFKTAPYLKVHKRTHTGDKPHKCTVCKKSFSNSSNLAAHKRTHNDTRPYKCTVCNMTFTYSSNLNRHKRIHICDKTHICTVCNKVFTQYYLTIHERIVHRGDRRYKCTICNKTFSYSSVLKRHTRTHNVRSNK